MKLNGLSPKDYLILISPHRVVTNAEGKKVKVKEKQGNLCVKKTPFIAHTFHTIGTFFVRLGYVLFSKHHQWFNDKRLVIHLSKNLEQIENQPLLKKIYRELKIRLSTHDAHIQEIQRYLKKQSTKNEILIPKSSDQTKLEQPSSGANTQEKIEFQKEIDVDHPLKKVHETQTASSEYLSVSRLPIALSAYAKAVAEAYKRDPSCRVEYQPKGNSQNIVVKIHSQIHHKKSVLDTHRLSLDLSKLPDLISKTDLIAKHPDFAAKISSMDAEYLSKEWIIKTYPDLDLSDLEVYFSGIDLRKIAPPPNGRTRPVSIFLEDLSKLNRTDDSLPAIAFKIGLENKRELLALKLLKHLGLDLYLLPKEEVTLEIKIKQHVNPTGLASEWLEGSLFPDEEWKTAWKELMKDKKELAAAEDQHLPEDKIHLLKEKVKHGEAKVLSLDHTPNIQHLALIDALFGSADSHEGQYKKDPASQRIFNFDFSRILFPSDFNRVSENNPSITVNFKSIFLDHPAVYEKMDEDLIQRIQKIDIEGFKCTFQDLVGTQESFLEALKDLNNLDNKPQKPLLSQLHKKYGLVSKKTSAEKIKKAILEQYFAKIHPDAYINLLSRLKLLKKYVTESFSPTVRGAFELMHPELGIFLKILQRTEMNPTLNVSFNGLTSRIMNTLLDHTSPEEKELVSEALKRAHETSCDVDMVRLIINV
ncbi:MAG: hypothetical protein BGO14_08260 [Chlamydiales bacterium 38-26]|nr:hypothetical protein [Chlamydiales bacterium]OJV10984.1 MAG: hypothetical protein BGO14_08260 [Chlamydiales bacterium 38-26]